MDIIHEELCFKDLQQIERIEKEIETKLKAPAHYDRKKTLYE